MIFKVLFVLTLASILQQGVLANLQQLASAGNCEFYNELERIKNCGQTGYLIAYGGKYCRKFGENFEQFNDDGKRWVNSVRKCLMSKILLGNETTSPVDYSCKQLENYAFETHVECYLNAGFGAKSICDIWASQNAVGLFKTFEILDFFRSPVAIIQVFTTGGQCLAKYGASSMQFLVDLQNNIMQALGGIIGRK